MRPKICHRITDIQRHVTSCVLCVWIGWVLKEKNHFRFNNLSELLLELTGTNILAKYSNMHACVCIRSTYTCGDKNPCVSLI